MIDTWINHTPNRFMFDIKVIHIDESTLLGLTDEEVNTLVLSFSFFLCFFCFVIFMNFVYFIARVKL
jgi:hypothetical protein